MPGLASATSTLLDALRWLAVSAVCVAVIMGIGMVFQRRWPRRAGTLALALWLVCVASSALLAGAYGYAGRVPWYSGFAPALFGLFFYFFADRRYLPPRARWLGLLYTVTVVGALGKPNNSSSAVHIHPSLVAFLLFVGDVLAVIVVSCGVIPQVYGRAARPRLSDEHRDAPWLAQAGGLLAIGFVILLVVVAVSPPDGRTPLPSVGLLVGRAALLVPLALLPVVAAFALARGERYDRAALVRRGAIYGALAVELAAVYAATLIAIHFAYASLIGLPPTFELDLAAPFITLTALLLIAVHRTLQPWTQATLDRRCFPRAHRATSALAEFQAALRVPLAPEDLFARLATAVQRAVAPERTLLWGRITASETVRLAERIRATAPVATHTGGVLALPERIAPDHIYLLQLYMRAESAGTPVARMLDVASDDPLAATLAPEIGAVSLAALPSRSAAGRALLSEGIALAMPLARPTGVAGLLGLGPRADGTAYTFDDRAFLAACAELAAPSLEDGRARQSQETDERERARVDQELRTAQRIQQALLPKEIPTLDGWRLAAFYLPAREVGGDFYDFLALPGGQLGLVLGDVSGKGIPAALVMATTRSMLRAVAETADGAAAPGDVLRRVNQLLSGDLPGGTFVTCFYGVLDPVGGTLRFANAGQDLPAQRRADGNVCELRATGMPLGLMPESEYEERTASIEPGASVLLYSDGLVEAHNAQREMFGFPRLAQAIGMNADAGVDAGDAPAIPALLRELAAFTGATWEQEDDITLVTFQRMSATRDAASVTASAAEAMAQE